MPIIYLSYQVVDFMDDNRSILAMYSDWHPQDWILIVEAIAQWDVLRDTDDARAYRARKLQAEIAAMHGFDDIVDFVEQSEDFLPPSESH